ncbi:MAG: methionine biosynthesis protein MetW [Deltaproteobacteria bacterium]|nr:methionine biosynthesis protein MetW [Deltaproteobacteria bacterium]
MSPQRFDNNNIRFDLQIIAAWVAPDSRVLDLGCGAGDLLHYLKTRKNVRGTGIEHDEEKVAQCVAKGVTVLQGDINAEVRDYPDGAFDTVILSQTLQQVYEPAVLLRTILRIGKNAVVSFPNFGHWLVRLQLLLTGYAPVTRQLPYEWYDTPNIRVISLKDFRKFARTVGFRVLKETAIRLNGRKGRTIGCMPNLRSSFGIFLIGK